MGKIHEAVIRGDLDEIKHLLEENPALLNENDGNIPDIIDEPLKEVAVKLMIGYLWAGGTQTEEQKKRRTYGPADLGCSQYTSGPR